MKKRKLASRLGILAVSTLSLLSIVSCATEVTEYELSHYSGENKDINGRSIYNKSLFYSNQINQGGPDPMVLDDTSRSGYYYLYSTLNNFHTSRSKDLCEWEDVGPAFLTNQTDVCKRLCNKNLWAPEVIYDEEMGKYLIFFSASPVHDTTVPNGEHGSVYARADETYTYNLYLALSDSPAGPFKIVNFADPEQVGVENVRHLNKQLDKVITPEEAETLPSVEQNGVFYEAAFPHYWADYCYLRPDSLSMFFRKNGWLDGDSKPDVGYIGSIDPSPFIDPVTGKKYLYWKSEDQGWNVISIVEMKNNNWFTPDFENASYVTVSNYHTIDDWRAHRDYGVSYEDSKCNEGPHTIYHVDKNGNGKYYMSFSTNGYGDSTYRVGTAVADNVLGPYRKLREYEGGLLVCSSTTESQTVSGAGHHSYMKVDDQEFIIYHRHIDYERGGGPRYTAIDEMHWVGIEDMNGDYLEVPYLNGPTDSVQPKPNKFTGYANIAHKAKVSSDNEETVNLQALNDQLLSVHKAGDEDFARYIPETEIAKTTTFTFDFEKTEKVRAILAYVSKREKSLFYNIPRVELTLEDGTVKVMTDLKYDVDQYCDYDEEIKQTLYSMAGSNIFAEFYEQPVKQIKMTVEVPENQKSAAISEIMILGKN